MSGGYPYAEDEISDDDDDNNNEQEGQEEQEEQKLYLHLPPHIVNDARTAGAGSAYVHMCRELTRHRGVRIYTAHCTTTIRVRASDVRNGHVEVLAGTKGTWSRDDPASTTGGRNSRNGGETIVALSIVVYAQHASSMPIDTSWRLCDAQRAYGCRAHFDTATLSNGATTASRSGSIEADTKLTIGARNVPTLCELMPAGVACCDEFRSIYFCSLDAVGFDSRVFYANILGGSRVVDSKSSIRERATNGHHTIPISYPYAELIRQVIIFLPFTFYLLPFTIFFFINNFLTYLFYENR